MHKYIRILDTGMQMAISGTVDGERIDKLVMGLAAYLHPGSVKLGFNLSDISVSVDRCIRIMSGMVFDASVKLSLSSFLKMSSRNALSADVRIIVESFISKLTTKMTAGFTNLRLGQVKKSKISHIEGFLVSEAENKTVDELCFTRID